RWVAYAVGRISSRHLNPAVSVGLVAGGRFRPSELAPSVAAQLLDGGPGGGPRVLVLSGREMIGGRPVTLGNFFGGDPDSRGGGRVAARDLNSDGPDDIVAGAGEGSGARVTAYDSAFMTPTGGPPRAPVAFDFTPGFTGGVFVG